MTDNFVGVGEFYPLSMRDFGSPNQLAGDLGFDDERDLANCIVAALAVGGSGTEAFKRWKQDDGTKAGLLALSGPWVTELPLVLFSARDPVDVARSFVKAVEAAENDDEVRQGLAQIDSIPALHAKEMIERLIARIEELEGAVTPKSLDRIRDGG